MPSTAGAIRSGRAFVELFADDSKLVAGLRAAQTRLKKWGKAITSAGLRLSAAGSALLAPFAVGVRSFSEIGDSIAKMAARTGLTVEQVSALRHATDLSATSIEELESSLTFFQRTLAAGGGDLEQFGLNLAALRGATPFEQLSALADAMASIQDPTERTAFAVRALGRGGTALIPLLSGGRAGLAAMAAEAQRLGLVMSGDSAAAAERLNDSLGTLWSQLKMVSVSIGASVAPALTALLDAAQPVLRMMLDWIRANGRLLTVLAAAGVGLSALGGSLLALGGLLKISSLAFGALSGIVSGLSAVLSALLSPVGLVAAAVAGVGTAAVWVSGTFEDFRQTAANTWHAVSETATTAWSAIVAAVSRGDLQAAADVAWAGITLVSTQAIGGISLAWAKFTLFFKEVFASAANRLAEILVETGIELLKGWSLITAGLGTLWTNFTAGLQKTWHATIGFIQKAWIRLKGLFKSDLNVDAEVARINAETEGKQSAIDAERDRVNQERGQALQQELDRLNRTREQMLESLQQQGQSELSQLEQQHLAKIEAQAERLRQAQQRFQQAVGRAQGETKSDAAGGFRLAVPPPDVEVTRSAASSERVNRAVELFTVDAQRAIAQALGQSRTDPLRRAAELTAVNTARAAEEMRGVRRSLDRLQAPVVSEGRV